MKKIVLVSLLAAMISMVGYAQKSNKELKKELRARVERECVKDAKKLTKEGWKVMSGKLPLDRQIQDARYAELDTDDKGVRMNFVGSHQAVGGNYSAAKQIADTRARAELAAQVGSTIASQVKDMVSNRNLGEGDIELLDETISATKTSVQTQLPAVTPLMEIYRELGGGKYEVRVVVSAPYNKTMQIAKSLLMGDLRKKSEALAAELDKQ